MNNSIQLTLQDKIYLSTSHPSLTLTGDRIVGRVSMGVSYDSQLDRFKLYYQPREDAVADILQIDYQIEIDFSSIQFGLPTVSNPTNILWDRFNQLSRVKRLKINTHSDMHLYSNHSFCLCADVDVQLVFPRGFSLERYFEKLLIPYLYYQQHLYLYKAEPWKGRSHGDLGRLESIAEQSLVIRKDTKMIISMLRNSLVLKLAVGKYRPAAKTNCLCGSGKRFRDCHNKAHRGLKRLWKLQSAK